MSSINVKVSILWSYLCSARSISVKSLQGSSLLLFIFVATIGLVARLWTMTRGHNFDFSSYLIVSDAVSAGSTPWETGRYNYGPIWAGLLWLLQLVSPDESYFRTGIVLILFVAELAIAALLWQKSSVISGMFVLLNPINIIIVGYHNQFDVLAIAIALFAMISFARWEKAGSKRQLVLALLLLGLSISVKHICIFFPIWLILRPMKWGLRTLILAVPASIFALSFAPFINRMQPIIDNVLSYQSSKNAALLGYFVDQQLLPAGTTTVLFLTALVVAAALTRRVQAPYALFTYLIVLVVFTPAMANQYLLIAAIGIAAFAMGSEFVNWPFLVFTAVAGQFLLIDINGLHAQPALGPIQLLAPFSEYGVLLLLLATGLLQLLLSNRAQLARLVWDSQRRDNFSGNSQVGI